MAAADGHFHPWTRRCESRLVAINGRGGGCSRSVKWVKKRKHGGTQ